MKNIIKTTKCDMAEIVSAYTFAPIGGGGNPLRAWVLAYCGIIDSCARWVLGCFSVVYNCFDWVLGAFCADNYCINRALKCTLQICFSDIGCYFNRRLTPCINKNKSCVKKHDANIVSNFPPCEIGAIVAVACILMHEHKIYEVFKISNKYERKYYGKN